MSTSDYSSRDKQQLRQRLKAERRAIPAFVQTSINDQICAHLHKALNTAQYSYLFAYSSFRAEVDLMPLLTQCQVPVALPLMNPKTKTMTFHLWSPEQELVRNRFGIFEPDPSWDVLVPDTSSLMLVPALAVDERGYRLGYGGGYYDRYLAQNKVRTIVPIAQKFHMLRLPYDSTDIPVDGIVCEDFIQWFA